MIPYNNVKIGSLVPLGRYGVEVLLDGDKKKVFFSKKEVEMMENGTRIKVIRGFFVRYEGRIVATIPNPHYKQYYVILDSRKGEEPLIFLESEIEKA